MIKRFCFDTESNFAPLTGGVGDIEYRRAVASDYASKHGPIRFDCGVVYDEQTDSYYEFERDELASFVAMLTTADELISHNGLRHDLPLLEQVCGLGAIDPLWSLQSHDLMEVIGWETLDALAAKYVPKQFEVVEQKFRARTERDRLRWPDVRFTKNYVGPPNERFGPSKLTKCRRDVELTYAVFREFESNGAKIILDTSSSSFFVKNSSDPTASFHFGKE